MAPRAAAIYARISSDRDGDGLGVSRQVEDCQAMAERRGWPVGCVYVDNDVSAYRGKARPEYRRMLQDISDGEIDAVVVWHLDRLHRNPGELEQFLEVVVDKAGVRDLACVSGHVDLATHDGQLMARIMGAVGRKESDDKSRRLRRKHQELAHAGKVSGGGTRPFGYEADRLTVRPDEAAVIREVAERVIAGDSKASICRDLNARGITTTTGGPWTLTTLSRMIASPRIAGQRTYEGEVVAAAQWPAIITPELSARVRAAQAAGAAVAARPPRRYLLAGLLRCALCDATLVSRPRTDGTRRYVCSKSVGHGGCGKIAVLAEPLEQLVTEAVLYRLDSPELAAALHGSDTETDAEATAARTGLEADQAQLDELAAAYAAKAITMSEWMTARDPIQARIRSNQRRLARHTQTTTVTAFVGNASELRARWSDLTLSRQQKIVKAILDHVVVAPATRHGSTKFEPGRFTPVWRV